MAHVKIYTLSTCPYCLRAKALLDRLGQSYEEVSVDGRPDWRDEVEALSGRRTVPQIFINDKSIGGCDDLYALHDSAKLSTLLK